MRCKIAELIVDVPSALEERCKNYRCENDGAADIVILEERYRPELYDGLQATRDEIEYQESGRQFTFFLLNFDGFYLHSSAVEMDGNAYLFSGPCGIGKSTHTRLWQSVFGEKAQVFNDDKPALRRMEDRWYAYGTPWCGKDGINQNKKVPLAGICFLRQAEHNRIRRLNPQEALRCILSQTIHRFKRIDRLDKMIALLDRIVQEIPIFELECLPDAEAAKLSFTTMRANAGDKK